MALYAFSGGATRQPYGTAVLAKTALTLGLQHAWAIGPMQGVVKNNASSADGVFGTGSPSPYGVYWLPGNGSYYLLLDATGTGTASSQVVTVGNSSGSGSPKNANFSLQFKIRLPSLGSIQSIYSGDTAASVQFRVNASGFLELVSRANAIEATSSVAITAGVDYDVGLTYEGNTTTFYINGKPAGTGSRAFSGFQLSSSHFLGAGNAAGQEAMATGSRIYYGFVWNRVRAAHEFQKIYENPWQIFEDPLGWVYYTPDGAAGVTGTLAQTLANATLSASGNQTILGTLSQTLANTAPNISGTTAILGSIGLNLSATILAASGSVGAAVSGTTAQTLANTTLSASGTTTVRGTVASTLAAVTSAISGTTNILGAAANTLGNVTLAASGAVGNAVAGTITGNLANVTLAASGNVTVRGSVSYTTENTTLSSSGTTQVQGTLGVTLAPTTLAAFGTSGTPVLSTAWRFLKLWMSKLGF